MIIGIIIVGYIIHNIINNTNQIKISFDSINYVLLSLSIIVLSIFILFGGLLWSFTLNKIDSKIKITDGLYAYIISLAAKYLPGGFWNLAGRIYYLKSKGNSVSSSSISIIYEMLFLIVSSIAVGSYFLYSQFNSYYVVLIIVALLFFFHPNLLNKSINVLLTLLKKQRFESQLNLYVKIKILIGYLISWLTYAVAFKILLQSLGFDNNINILLIAAILSSSWLIGYLSPTPGGIGVREGIMILLISSLDNLSEAAYVIAVIARLWFLSGELLLVLIFGSTNIFQHLRRKNEKLSI